jgi:hypothetical protein
MYAELNEKLKKEGTAVDCERGNQLTHTVLVCGQH